MELKYISLYTNYAFYSAIAQMKLIARCERFNEYKASSNLQIFVRVPLSLMEDKELNNRVNAFVEPQINLTASLRENKTAYKIQITVLPDFEQRFSGVKVTRYETRIDFNSFTDILKSCNAWNDAIEHMVTEDGEFDFGGAEGLPY